MPVDEQQVKLTAKERREKSDAILEDVYKQLLQMAAAKKVDGHSVAVMKRSSNSS